MFLHPEGLRNRSIENPVLTLIITLVLFYWNSFYLYYFVLPIPDLLFSVQGWVQDSVEIMSFVVQWLTALVKDLTILLIRVISFARFKS